MNQIYSPQRYSAAEVTKIGANAPKVPRRGKKTNWLYPAFSYLENRPKSGMLTARDENRPMMTLSALRADQAALIPVVRMTGPETRGPPPWVTMALYTFRKSNGKGYLPPEEQREKCRRDDNSFEGKKPPEAIHRKKRDSRLYYPIEEHHQERAASDIRTFW
jgi:hypothetical protein